ncbi:hypothetical protein ACQCLI_31870 (plasmid) [Pseudomonas nitroreducens]|uniref:hypothetical protein n=1 Tax=Pseudomonas TaxID=286 RepID=UPI0002EECEA1|nr:hypothetical protein [Pseudomonas nitroreducens]
MQNNNSTTSHEQRYSELLGSISWEFDNPPPSFAEMKAHVQGLLEDDGEPASVARSFKDFNAFFAWFDAVTAFDQMDAEESAEDLRVLLEVVYESICSENS